MENKSSKPLHQCYNISGFPSNQQKRVSERTLVKVRGQGHSARSKSTGLLQVWENPDTVYREDAVYCLGHAAEGGAGHAGLRLRLLPPRTFCGGHDLSIYVSYFFLIILFVFCLSCSFKSGNGKILWKNYFIDKTCYTVLKFHTWWQALLLPLQSEVMSLGKSQHLDLLSVLCHGISDLFIFTYTFEMIVHVFPLFCIYS